MSVRFALDIAQYQRDLKAAISKISGGYWIGMANAHGSGATAYHLFTLCNIGAEQVTVFYPNFEKPIKNRSIVDFINETTVLLPKIGVAPILTLQDGQSKAPNTLFPLLHLFVHMINVLKRYTLRYYSHNTSVYIYEGKIFEQLLLLNIPLNQLVSQCEAAKNNTDRGQDPLSSPIITEQMFRFFKGTYDRYRAASRHDLTHDRTHEVVVLCLNFVNLMQARKDLKTDVELTTNAANITSIITEIENIISNPLYIWHPGSDLFSPLLPLYKEIFNAHPLIPYEAFLFCFEYEVAITSHQNKYSTNPDYLFDRIQHGMIYPDDFSYWCGTTKKNVLYQKINIEPYKSSMKIFLPK